jgi:hypothetical protein
MRVRLALAGGLALIALTLLRTLAHAPLVPDKARSVPPETQLVATTHDIGGCQSREVLPRGTVAIRLGLFGVTSPEVALRVFAGSRVLTEGTLPAGWSGEGATVPVPALPRTVAPVRVCFTMESVTGEVTMVGRRTPPADATVGGARPLPGRIAIEYLHPGSRSWASLAVSVARRLGLGRAAAGTGNALLVLVLALTVLTLSSWLVVRDLR